MGYGFIQDIQGVWWNMRNVTSLCVVRMLDDSFGIYANIEDTSHLILIGYQTRDEAQAVLDIMIRVKV